MSTEFSKEIDWFARQMKSKMGQGKNLAKGHWSGLGRWELWRRACHELTHELTVAIDDCQMPQHGPGKPEAVIAECCDVANFMMMIADNAKNGLLGTQEPPDAE